MVVGFVFETAVFSARTAIQSPGSVRCALRPLWGAPDRNWRSPTIQMGTFAAAALILLPVPLHVARAVQHHAIGQLLPQYLRAELLRIPVEPHPLEDWVLFRRTAWEPPHSGTLCKAEESLSGLWAADFAGGTEPRPVYIRYICKRGGDDYSQGVWGQPGGTGNAGNTRYFFPVYEETDFKKRGWLLFDGIAVRRDQVQDFKGLYRVQNDSSFPLFLNMSIPADLSAFLDHQVVFGRKSPTIEPSEDEGLWFPKDPELEVPDINDIAQMPDPIKAADRFATALKSDEGNPVLRLGLATALDAKGDVPAALEAYRQALAANPRFYVTYHYIDAFFSRRNDLDGRVAQWRVAARSYPENWLPFFHLALAFKDKPDTEGALEAYRQTAALNPSDAQTWNDIARLLTDKDDVAGAVEAFQQAHQLDPSNPNLLMDLGDLKMRQQDSQNAQAMFRAAIDLDPEQQRGHRELLELLMQNGEFTAAWQEVDECRKRHAPVDDSTLARLKELSGRSS